MSKYRQFNQEELSGLEDEFVKYLVVNGIEAEDWVSIKEYEHSKAEDILHSFSQVIWESILRKTEFLDLYEKQSILSFYCGEKEIIFRGVKTDDSTYDFTQAESIERSKHSPPHDLSSIHSNRVYHKSREEEIYDLITKGAQPSDGKLFHSLS